MPRSLNRIVPIVLIALVWAGFAGLTGCASATAEGRFDVPGASAYRLLAVDIENYRGSVEVRVDPRLSEAQVEAFVYGAAFTGDDQTDEAVARAVDLDSYIDETAPGIGTLRVRTTTADADPLHAVALRVYVPRCDGARVVNRGGLVELVGTSGPVDIDNHSGDVEFRTNRPFTDDASVLVVDGTVYFQIPPGSTGFVDLETLEGKAIIKNRDGDALNTYTTQEIIQTRLGEGDNAITMRTNFGDLRLWVMDDPESLTRVFRGRAPDFAEGLFLQGSRRHTRNLPDDEPRVDYPE